MYSILLPLVALLWLPSVFCVNTTMAQRQCRKLLDLEKFSYCCGLSLVDKFLFVGSNCTDYWEDYGACRYECLYKHWMLLDEHNNIKKPELYTMITKLYNGLNGYQRYGSVFKEANEYCEALGTTYTNFVLVHANEMKNKLGLETECQPEAMFHSQCIMVHVTQTCPSEFWRSVTECETLRTLIKNCLPSHFLFWEDPDENRDMDTESNGTRKRMPLSPYFFLLSSFLSMVLSSIVFT